MANENIPTTQTPRTLASILTGGPTVVDLVFTGPVSGVYSVEDSGTPAGYQDLAGAVYELDTGAAAHDGFAKIINGVAISK